MVMMEYFLQSIELNLHVSVFTVLCDKNTERQMCGHCPSWTLKGGLNELKVEEEFIMQYVKVTHGLLAWPGKSHILVLMKNRAVLFFDIG